jgi:hypothetical protein
MHRKVRKQSFQCNWSHIKNLSEINGNHQNNRPTVTTGIADIIMVVATIVGCCAFAGLVPPHSPKLGLTYLKTEAC